jgi:hypothetical protein
MGYPAGRVDTIRPASPVILLVRGCQVQFSPAGGFLRLTAAWTGLWANQDNSEVHFKVKRCALPPSPSSPDCRHRNPNPNPNPNPTCAVLCSRVSGCGLQDNQVRQDVHSVLQQAWHRQSIHQVPVRRRTPHWHSDSRGPRHGGRRCESRAPQHGAGWLGLTRRPLIGWWGLGAGH